MPLEFGKDDGNGAQSSIYLEINSQGKVPTLVHDDFILTESAAIINYIDQLSGKNLVPMAAQQRAKYDELCSFITTELEQPLWNKGKHTFALPEQHRVEQILDTTQWEFAKALDALSKLSDLEQYALGDQFSFADILLAHTLNWAERFKFEVPENLLAYRNRMYLRDAATRAVAQVI